MKVLIVDNKGSNRNGMANLLQQQSVIDIAGRLEAPNLIMGSMLIDAIDFDLVILGGMLDGMLPDGSEAFGSGVTLAREIFARRMSTKVVLWSDNPTLREEFSQLMAEYDEPCLEYHCWQKQIALSELEHHLWQLFYQMPDGYKSGQNYKVI